MKTDITPTSRPARYRRTDRLSQLIKEELSDIFLRKVSDPRLHSITITGVDVRPDLRTATVKVCKMMTGAFEEPSAEDKKKVIQALHAAYGFIFEHLRKRLQIKFVPELEFQYDSSLAESSEMWGKIRQLDLNKNTASEETPSE